MKKDAATFHSPRPMLALGEIVDPVSNWTPSRAASAQSFTYIDLSAIDQDAKLIVAPRVVPCRDAPSRARQLVAAGDILVSSVRPNLNAVARVPEYLDKATASTGFCVLRPQNSRVDTSYLFHWVKTSTFVAEMVKQATGANYPAVSDKIVLQSRIPLPALSEQRRIAAILDQADALRAKRRAGLAQLETLTQSIFLEMFGDPATNSKRWPERELENVCEAVNDCPHSTPMWTEAGVVCLRTSNLTEGGWNWDDTRYVSEATYHERSKRSYATAGDIILSREGTVGIAAIVQSGMALCMGQRLVQVRSNAETLDSEYLLRHLLYVLDPRRIGQVMVGSTSQHLNVKELRALRTPLPPIELQREFAGRVLLIVTLKKTQCAALAALDHLFAVLQHRAFRGEL